MPITCSHGSQAKLSSTDKRVCEDCIKTGDRWVQLRLCLTCGHVGCCDSSKNQHARQHFQQTTHPIITSANPGEDWVWCYVDEDYVGNVGGHSSAA